MLEEGSVERKRPLFCLRKDRHSDIVGQSKMSCEEHGCVDGLPHAAPFESTRPSSISRTHVPWAL